MKYRQKILIFPFLALLVFQSISSLPAQDITSKESVLFYTSEWLGERLPDGRPKVPDAILKRIEKISIEEAWGYMNNLGYVNQFEGNWQMIDPQQPIVGRVLTAQYMPARPDIKKMIEDRGHAEGRIGAGNSWPIDQLQKGDVYVADCFGKVVDGTLIGDNLGNAIYSKSGNGVVFNGGLRDLEGLEEIEGFNAFVRGWDPSYLKETMLTGINIPVRIGRAIVLPGDVVLAKREGVIFIPAHLAQQAVERAEAIMLRDRFGHQRLREGKYTPGQIDRQWTDDIEADFYQWLEQNKNDLEIPAEVIEDMLKKRSW